MFAIFVCFASFLQTVKQIVLPAVSSIDRWIGTHEIFLLAEQARNKSHQTAPHPHTTL
jgi:hypothetical protein